jgi:hypothetical protein
MSAFFKVGEVVRDFRGCTAASGGEKKVSLFVRSEVIARTATHHSSRPRLAKVRRTELPSVNNPPFIPARKENSHEAGCTKKFAAAQETKEAPCLEKVPSGEEIKRNGSVKIED